MLSPKRDQISREGEVVANEDPESDGDLESETLVVRRPKADRGGELLGLAPAKVDDAEEESALALDGVGFVADLEITAAKLFLEGRHEFGMGDGLPGPCGRRRIDPLEFAPRDLYGA